MKAAVYTEYGPADVLRLMEVPRPKPKDDEVLVRIHAATVNRTDCGFRTAEYFISRLVTGLRRPRRHVGGSEFAGEVVEVGKAVTLFEIGDRVFGFEDVRSGAHAEYMVVREQGSIAHMPFGTTFEDMAPAGEGASYALNLIRAARVTAGQNVLVYGATGAIGSAAVQILKHLGVSVTAVCGSKSIKTVEALGADVVLDYEKGEFERLSARFNLVLDAVGKRSYAACKRLLLPTGIYCSTELGKRWENPLLALWFGVTRQRRVIFPFPILNKEKILYIRELVASGAFKPLVDRTYKLDEIVEAARYVESGQKIGNVVLNVA